MRTQPQRNSLLWSSRSTSPLASSSRSQLFGSASSLNPSKKSPPANFFDSIRGTIGKFFAFLRKILARFLRIKSSSIKEAPPSPAVPTKTEVIAEVKNETPHSENTTPAIAIRPTPASRNKSELADAQKVVAKKLEQIKGASKKPASALETTFTAETVAAEITEAAADAMASATSVAESASEAVQAEASVAVESLAESVTAATHELNNAPSSVLTSQFDADSLLELPPLVALSKIDLDFSKQFAGFQDSIGKLVDDVEKWLEPIQKFNASTFSLLPVPEYYMRESDKSLASPTE